MPTDDGDLYRWIFIFMVLYLLVAYAARWLCLKKLGDQNNRFLLTRIFDSATFSGSVILLAGIMDDQILRLLGNTKPFLLVAGLAGVIYGLHALNPYDQA